MGELWMTETGAVWVSTDNTRRFAWVVDEEVVDGRRRLAVSSWSKDWSWGKDALRMCRTRLEREGFDPQLAQLDWDVVLNLDLKKNEQMEILIITCGEGDDRAGELEIALLDLTTEVFRA